MRARLGQAPAAWRTVQGGGERGGHGTLWVGANGCAQRCVRGARSLVGQPRRVWGAASTAESWVASCQSGRMALTMAGCAAAAAATATIASVAAAAAITRAAAAAAAVAPAVAPAVPTRRRRRRLHGIGVVAGTQPCPPRLAGDGAARPTTTCHVFYFLTVAITKGVLLCINFFGAHSCAVAPCLSNPIPGRLVAITRRDGSAATSHSCRRGHGFDQKRRHRRAPPPSCVRRRHPISSPPPRRRRSMRAGHGRRAARAARRAASAPRRLRAAPPLWTRWGAPWTRRRRPLDRGRAAIPGRPRRRWR